MKEQFVPYELALQLKELGFSESCIGVYYGVNNKRLHIIGYSNSEDCPNVSEVICDAPLWQQAFDWFTERGVENWIFSRIDSKVTQYDFHIQWDWSIKSMFASEECFKTHEMAKQACLLKLIETTKED